VKYGKYKDYNTRINEPEGRVLRLTNAILQALFVRTGVMCWCVAVKTSASNLNKVLWLY
jgi:hypothetical protein